MTEYQVLEDEVVPNDAAPAVLREGDELQFIHAMTAMAAAVHQTAVSKGWWEGACNDGEKIALMHSELSEALEALRAGNPQCDKPIELSAVEEEMADVLIRMMDWAQFKGFDLGRAVVAKARYNAGRSYRHGGKAF